LRLETLKDGALNVLDVHQAYLNFVEDRLEPDVWVNEKSFPNSTEHQGIEGKLKRIAKLCKS